MNSQEAAQKWTLLPQKLKKLIPKPQFTNQQLSNITLKTVQSYINHIKTKTLLSLLSPPPVQPLLPQPQKPPIILIFCQPSQQLPLNSQQIYPYTPIAYSSWLQSCGAKCIPLPYNLNQSSIDFLLQRTHGMIIPGGGANLYKNYQKKEGFGPVMVGFLKIWRKINKIWEKGGYYPVWGTCLGLEIVVMAITMDVKILSNLNSRAHQLEVYLQYQNSKIFSNMPLNLRMQIQNKKLLNFQHVYGISLQKFLSTPKLSQKLNIVGLSKDKSNKWFCSYLQSKTQPLFLSQFHPQKQAFQWSMKGDILHEKYSIQISQWISHSFLKQCLKNKPRPFDSVKQENFYLIQQYKQIHTPLKMYKVYAIDYKFREKQKDKQSRKEIKSQKSISLANTIGTNKSIKANFV